MITETRIRTLGEFVDRVTPREPDRVTGRRRDFGVYRGSSNAAGPLLTSLDRLGGPEALHSKADLEEHILRNYIRYARPYIGAEASNDWEQLISAQHHGVPTRLLDWSYSPLVAVFFATRPSAIVSDRAVWRLDWQAVHHAFDFPPLALRTSDLDRLLDGGRHYSPWQLFAREDREKPFACLLEPPSIDARIVAQAAAFTLCSDPCQAFDAFLEEHRLGDALVKFIIPGELVSQFRDQLDLVGVDERRLFPDLDGVAAALRRYYA